jgi:DNA-binding MarR family transcriptional regulator
MMQLSITKDADQHLADRGMGRVHHRLLYFAHFSPGITVGELLTVLGVRHQNIQRPLQQLIKEGYLVPRPCPKDGRVKQLYCSDKGDNLLEIVSGGQRERIARAYSRVTPQDIESHFKVMVAMLDPDRREWVDRLTDHDGQIKPS